MSSAYVTRAYVEALPPVPTLGRWHRPIPHIELVDQLLKTSRAHGLEVKRERFVSQSDGQILFALFDFARDVDSERGWSIGLRSSTNSRLAVELVAGFTVFVCDNLLLAGDTIVLHRKSTRRFDLRKGLEAGFLRYEARMEKLDAQVETMRRTVLDRDDVKRTLFDVFARRALPSRLFHAAVRTLFRPSETWTDVLGYDGCPKCETGTGPHAPVEGLRQRLQFRQTQLERSLWGVHNACTRAMKTLPPGAQIQATVRLGRVLGLD